MELTDELFERLPLEHGDINEMVRPSISYWQDVWRRLKQNKYAVGGLAFVIFITLIAILAPVLTPYDYYSQDLSNANATPSSLHWFGLDQFGRDLLTRVIYGARISMTVGYVTSVFTLVIGIFYGGIAGFSGGRIDNVMMRIVDILSGIPSLLYLILLMVTLGPGLQSIIIAMSITGWLGMARMVRAEVLKLREQEFVLAAKALGISDFKILLRHLIPNSMGTILVNLTFSIPNAIFSEAFLSFLGLGVSAPKASWGVLSSEAVQTFQVYPHQLFFPSLAICLTILAFNYLGDGLRDAMDPKMRR